MFNERFKNALVDLKGAYHFFETTEHLNVHLYYCDENTKKNNPLYASFISAEDIFFYNLTNDIKHNVDRLIMKRHEDYNTMIDEFVRTDKCVMEYSLQLYKKMYILHEKKDITKIPLYEQINRLSKILKKLLTF